jgi:probable F420-dependent oxidoreductase
MTEPRPFRFGYSLKTVSAGIEFRNAVRRVEDMGFDVLLVSDHYSPTTGAGLTGRSFAPLTAMAWAASVTSRIRIGTHVLCADFRNVGVLAKELATLDVLSDGRLEVGLGAGYLEADFRNLGIELRSPADRVKDFECYVRTLTMLLSGNYQMPTDGMTVPDLHGPSPLQQPHPPILIGAQGPRMLRFAAGAGDIVSLLGRGRLSLAESVRMIAEIRGERNLDAAELNTIMHPGHLSSQHHLGGSLAEMMSFLQDQREMYGISYISFSDASAPPEHWAGVVQALSGR